MFEKFFLYTRSEQKGIIVLFTIILILLSLRLITPLFLNAQYKNEVSEYERYFTHLNDSLLKASVKKDTLFYFEPNMVTSEELELLGFSSYQSRNLIAYRNAGGVFKSSKDLAKLYGMDSILLKRISPYVLVKEKERNPVKKYSKPKSEKKVIVKADLNKATVSELIKIRGIGNVYANRIIKFRTGLGGFHNINQLNEVYGLSVELSQELKKYFYVGESDVVKIDLKTVSQYDLVRHSYLNKQQSQQLLDVYKDCVKVGELDSLYNRLRENDLEKIIPYIRIN